MAGRQITAAGSETKEKLLQVAERLFAQKGFYGAGLREIGGEVGISNASLLYHFKSKGQLYAAVLDRIAKRIEKVASKVEKTDGDHLDRFRALYDGYFDEAQGNPDHARIVMREMMDNMERVGDIKRWYLSDSMKRLSAVIAAGQKGGVFRDCDPELFLYHLLGSVSYFILGLPTIGRVMDWDDKKALADFREQTFKHLIRSLVKKKALKDHG